MTTATIKPTSGRVLRDHTDGYSLITDEGKSVHLDRVFRKRIADGDAELVKQEAAPEVAPEPVSKLTESQPDNRKDRK
jgi:hypothetical protein